MPGEGERVGDKMDASWGLRLDCEPGYRGKRLLQTHTLIGQEVQLPSSDWTRATQL